MLVSAFVGLGIAVATTPASAARMTQKLTATAHAPRARGRAIAKLESDSRGRLQIRAGGLAAQASFDVVANGVKVATLQTSESGRGRALLATHPRGHAALLGFDPRGADLEVRDMDGHAVLVGTMPGRGTEHADKIACCLPHGGPDCAIRPAKACAAEGGTPASTGTCLPDPCGGGGSTGGAFVCCIAESEAGAFVDDDPAVECEAGSTSADCAAAGGTLVQATSCHPDPCTPVPPPDLVVCCVAEHAEDDDTETEVECERVTADRCAAKGGVVSAATSCESNPCGGGSADGAFCDHEHEDEGGEHHPGGHHGGRDD
jgi:hypothetical protein